MIFSPTYTSGDALLSTIKKKIMPTLGLSEIMHPARPLSLGNSD
jgi:hypothetical protein